jgi:hypothetical protein
LGPYRAASGTLKREGWHKRFMAGKEIPPIRVWLFALAILAILAVSAVILFAVLDDPFMRFADRGAGAACSTGTAAGFMLHGCA